jgi:hypothetical protein
MAESDIDSSAMWITALLLLAALSDSVHNGRLGKISVSVPRLDSAVAVDGVIDEGVWKRAARLTGFSQYQPVDGRPAVEPTEVLVWYSSDAIHFGIRATELHGDVVRATRANRDDIASEDHVQILLDTDNGRQLAFLFGVNPLGVQQDGTRGATFAGGAGGASATGGGFRNINPLDGSVDLNPDYVFESRGRLVPGGYEVEIRIPFKSLRYQDAAVQSWGIHVLRRVQHTGFQDTWAPAVRANANFLAQSGTLEGLRDMHRGLVLEAAPTVTARLDGSPRAGRDRVYKGESEFGGDARWGIRQNLTLNATINPDFSQVEADVGQVLLNERFALFYPEKRPFFLDGLELFDTPNQLIYTRQIVEPVGGVKLTGRLSGVNAAAMLVQDDDDQSYDDSRNPLFGVVRLRREFGRAYTLGSVFTTREDGDDFSRLAGADVRVYHSKLYWVQLQAAQSWLEPKRLAASGRLGSHGPSMGLSLRGARTRAWLQGGFRVREPHRNRRSENVQSSELLRREGCLGPDVRLIFPGRQDLGLRRAGTPARRNRGIDHTDSYPPRRLAAERIAFPKVVRLQSLRLCERNRFPRWSCR